MNGNKATARSEASGWLERADHDLRAVRLCLNAADFLPDIAAYHCQQAGEKLIKGVLVLAGISFRKTHDLENWPTSRQPAFRRWLSGSIPCDPLPIGPRSFATRISIPLPLPCPREANWSRPSVRWNVFRRRRGS